MNDASKKQLGFATLFCAVLLFWLIAALAAAPAQTPACAAEQTVSISGGNGTKDETAASYLYYYTLQWRTMDTFASGVNKKNAENCYFFAEAQAGILYSQVTTSAGRHTDVSGNRLRCYFNKSSVTTYGSIVSISFASNKEITKIGAYNATTGLRGYGGELTLSIKTVHATWKTVYQFETFEMEKNVTAARPIYGLAKTVETLKATEAPAKIKIPASVTAAEKAHISVYLQDLYGRDQYEQKVVECGIYSAASDNLLPVRGVSLSFVSNSSTYLNSQQIQISVTNEANYNSDANLQMRLRIGAGTKAVYTNVFELQRSEYTARFDAGGVGSVTPASQTVVHGQAPSFPTLTADGYTLAGWSTTANGAVLTSPPAMTEDMKFYARWTANTYSVTLETDGGTVGGDYATSYTYGVGAALPTAVTKTGYTFNGWYTAASGGTKVTAVSATDFGDKTYYAQYTEKATVSLDEAAQTYTYDGEAQAFGLAGASAGLGGFSVQYADAAGNVCASPTNAGIYAVTISRGEDAVYKSYEVAIAGGLVIQKATPTVHARVNTNSVYEGAAKPTLSIATDDTAGTLAWDADQDWTPGTREFRWTFTPTDTANYTGATGAISLTVKADVVTGISAAYDPTGITVYTSVPDAAALKTLIAGGLTVTAAYASGKNATVTDYTLFYSALTGDADNSVTVRYAGKETVFTNLYVTAVALKSISASLTQDRITVYTSTKIGDLKALLAFGLSVLGTNNDGSAFNGGAAITDYTLSFPAGVTAFSAGENQAFVVSYGGKSTTVNTLTVTAVALRTIAITVQPQRKTYAAFDTFDPTGMAVTASYNDGSSRITTAYTVKYQENADSLRVGHTIVSLKCTENGYSAVTTVTGLSVAKKQFTPVGIQGVYVYTGVEQTAALVNFDAAFMEVAANRRTPAGKQSVTVTLKDTANCEWSDQTTAALSLEWTIGKVTLTPGVSGIACKTYDGSTAAGGAIGLSGAVNGEEPTATATFVWTSANAGTATVDVTNITLGEAWTTNYELSLATLSNQSYGTAKIGKAVLTPGVSGIASKTYDGSTAASGTIGLSGAVNGEEPTATGTFVWTSANAGTATVDVTGITLGEAWTTNYELSAATLTAQSYGTAKIGKAVLTPGVSGIASKTYDGSTAASGTIGLSGAVNGEEPTATGTFVWTSANAGTATVDVTGITLGEAWTTNYELSAATLTAQSYGAAKIGKAVLTPGVSGIASKTYDGTTEGEGAISLSGAVNGEEPTATGTFVWTSADAGTATFDVTNIALGEAWTTNYELSLETLIDQSCGTAGILAAEIVDKGAFTDYGGFYDKQAHGIGYQAARIEVVNAQSVTVFYRADETEAWSTSPITYTSFTDGAQTVYWKVSAPNHSDITGSNTVTIAKKAVTVTAQAKSSTHKADLAALTYTVSPALYAGDGFTGALATDADKALVGVYDITQGTLSAGDNYAVTFVRAQYTVIAKATVTITRTAQKFTYDGEARAFAIEGSALDGFSVEYEVDGAYRNHAPANAGTYRVRVTRAEDADYYAFRVEIAGGLVIAAQQVAKPAENVASFTYTGAAQTYVLAEDGRYAVSNALRTDAGSQTVTVALKDQGNYEWTDGTTDDVTFTFTIDKASARITVDDAPVVKTFGDVWTLPEASSNFGTVVCDTTVEQMRNAGAYTVTYTVPATDNYFGDVRRVSVTVRRQQVAVPDPDPTVFVEDGTPKTYAVAADDRYAVSGHIRTDSGSYTVTVALLDPNNHEWADGTTDDLCYAFVVRRPQLAEKIDDNAEKEDVIVSADDGFAPDVAVEITVVPQLSEAREAVAESEKVSAIYDVKLLIGGVPTQPDGTITIRFLIPDECVGTAFRLLHIHGGEASELDYTIDGDYAVVATDRLSEFVFVTDNTGSVWWVMLILAVVLLAEIVLAAVKLGKNAKGKKAAVHYSCAPLLAVFIPAGQIYAAAVLGALCVAGGIYNAYLYLWKKNKPQDNALPAAEPGIAAATDSNDLPNASEAGIAADTPAGDRQILQGVEKAAGLAIVVRYKKSFTAKLIQSSDATKKYYARLKNAVLSYEKTKSRVSWHYDSISAGRIKLAKFGVKGKTLDLYLALDPDDYTGTKYKVERAESRRYADTPCLYKLKNARRAKYALELLDALRQKYGLVKGEEQRVDYAFPYETTEALIGKGLVKELVSEEEYARRPSRRQGPGTVAQSMPEPGVEYPPIVVPAPEQVDFERSLCAREPEPDDAPGFAVSVPESIANGVGAEAAAALAAEKRRSAASGKRAKSIVNLDSVASKYRGGETVNLQTLKAKGLIGPRVNYYKVLARGKLNKPLIVEADEFSSDALRTILLTGGQAIKISRDAAANGSAE